VQNGSFLRASLFTSVLAFGVATLVAGLGLWSILLGLAILALDRRYRQVVVPVDRSAPAVA
jgi:hypothetical protein